MKSPSGQTIFNSLCAPGSRGNSRTHFPGLLARCPFAFLWSACPFAFLWVACRLPPSHSGYLLAAPWHFSGLLAACLLPFRISLGCLPAAPSHSGCLSAAPSHFTGLLAGCPFAFGLLAGLPGLLAFGRFRVRRFRVLVVADWFCRLAAPSHVSASLAGCPFAFLWVAPFAFLWVACWLPHLHFSGVACRLPLRISLSCLPAAPSHLSGLLAGCPIAFL